MSPFPAWLADSHSGEDLLAAMPPLDRQDYYDRLDGHVCPDNCGICGGEGCDACLDCRCRRCDPYVPEYVRNSIKNWRPAS